MTSPRSAARQQATVAFSTAFAAAMIGALATDIGPWYHALKKPAWQPPDWLFGPVWTLIFGLIALSGLLAWRRTGAPGSHRRLLALFALNLVLNAAWSFLFFRFRRPDWALAEVVPLWLSIVALIVYAATIDARTSALLLLPYLLWVAFAAVLNLSVVRLNGPFPLPASNQPGVSR